MIYPMEHDVSIGSPFLKLDGNGLHSAHVSNKKNTEQHRAIDAY